MQDSFAKCVKVLEADLLTSVEKDERARLAAAMGGLGRNWTALQETIRILKGDPLPGSLKPVPKAKQKTRSLLTKALMIEEPACDALALG